MNTGGAEKLRYTRNNITDLIGEERRGEERRGEERRGEEERRGNHDPRLWGSQVSQHSESGAVSWDDKVSLAPPGSSESSESWFIPQHVVHQNGKDRVFFDCTFRYRGQSLNELLLLRVPLLGVLLRFRQHSDPTAELGELRFIWRDMQRNREPPVPEPLLSTFLTKVKEILNGKPLGYISVDAADPDPFTPHVLLTGWYNPLRCRSYATPTVS
ncbi:hypothetical protein D4764_05G0008920 [Takifugu flavidus]|uniref:Uncharacterized protein n=1 Tax=Takifugu flavidus TaxID=433684 RepID=A0A5C6N035_9TELE|nr:hypothetical protein D4764_05G0008920 [Takifugu flavidus]